MSASCTLDRLLSPDAEIIHRTQRMLFEKRIVALAGHRHVLYRFPVPWRARRLAALLRAGEQKGIAMQRPEYVGARWRELIRHGGCWLVASFEAGDALKTASLNEDNVRSLATSLARLHSMTGRRHGPLFRPGPYFQSFADGVNEDIGLVLESSDIHEGEDQREMAAWLQGQDGFLHRMKAFHVVHGDLLAKNILLREGGAEVCLIDYELAAFDHAGFEVAAALLRFFGGRNKKYRAVFLERYLAECDAAIRRDWAEHGHYFLVASALRLARTRIRRRSALLSRGEEDEAALQTGRFNGFMATAFALMRAYNRNLRTPEEMLAAEVR